MAVMWWKFCVTSAWLLGLRSICSTWWWTLPRSLLLRSILENKANIAFHSQSSSMPMFQSLHTSVSYVHQNKMPFSILEHHVLDEDHHRDGGAEITVTEILWSTKQPTICSYFKKNLRNPVYYTQTRKLNKITHLTNK